MIGKRFWLVASLLVSMTPAAQGQDEYEVDDDAFSANVLWPSAAPQRHTLTPGDVDFMRIAVEANRSYEVLITNSRTDWVFHSLQRESIGGTLLQSGTFIDRGNFRRGLRWVHEGPGELQYVRVALGAGIATVYDIALRETTLYCPRFNNSGSQVSVLIVQRAANERAENCQGVAYFYNEDQAVVGTQALVIGGQSDVNVYSLPGVPGLAGQKGGAQIAHTCGLGGLKAKLVSLEPATGFSFDTACTVREF